MPILGGPSATSIHETQFAKQKKKIKDLQISNLKNLCYAKLNTMRNPSSCFTILHQPALMHSI